MAQRTPSTSKVEDIVETTSDGEVDGDFVVEDLDDDPALDVVDPFEGLGQPDEPRPEAAPSQSMTTTQSFLDARPATVDSVEDLGVELVDPEAESFIVRVWQDVGPIFYGNEEVHLLKNHRYRVKPHIYAYLTERRLLWEQQVQPDEVVV